MGWLGLEPRTNALKGRLSVFLTDLKTVTCNNNIYLLLLCCSGRSGKDPVLEVLQIAPGGHVKAANTSMHCSVMR